MVKLIFYTDFILLFLFLKIPDIKSQDIVHVVEKRIEKQFKTNLDEKIKIIANKAEIKINGWEKDELKLIIKFTASNKNKAIAEAELKYAKYSIFKEHNEDDLHVL